MSTKSYIIERLEFSKTGDREQMVLNEKIKELRTTMGISQVTLASELGVTKQCISNWENDNIQPSIEMLVKMADYFTVSTDELLGRATNCSVSLDGLSSEIQAHVRSLVKDLKNL